MVEHGFCSPLRGFAESSATSVPSSAINLNTLNRKKNIFLSGRMLQCDKRVLLPLSHSAQGDAGRFSFPRLLHRNRAPFKGTMCRNGAGMSDGFEAARTPHLLCVAINQ
ncbi:MAG TPA: hypothetical protein PLC55_03570 [Zoogloea sp.]|nr:hypothetical protein [Zoogloea sp.]